MNNKKLGTQIISFSFFLITGITVFFLGTFLSLGSTLTGNSIPFILFVLGIVLLSIFKGKGMMREGLSLLNWAIVGGSIILLLSQGPGFSFTIFYIGTSLLVGELIPSSITQYGQLIIKGFFILVGFWALWSRLNKWQQVKIPKDTNTSEGKKWQTLFSFFLLLIIVSGIAFPHIQRQLFINEVLWQTNDLTGEYRQSFTITNPEYLPSGWTNLYERTHPGSIELKYEHALSNSSLYMLIEENPNDLFCKEKRQHVVWGWDPATIIEEAITVNTNIGTIFTIPKGTPPDGAFEVDQGYTKVTCWQTENYAIKMRCSRAEPANCPLANDELVRIAESMRSTQ